MESSNEPPPPPIDDESDDETPPEVLLAQERARLAQLREQRDELERKVAAAAAADAESYAASAAALRENVASIQVAADPAAAARLALKTKHATLREQSKELDRWKDLAAANRTGDAGLGGARRLRGRGPRGGGAARAARVPAALDGRGRGGRGRGRLAGALKEEEEKVPDEKALKKRLAGAMARLGDLERLEGDAAGSRAAAALAAPVESRFSAFFLDEAAADDGGDGGPSLIGGGAVLKAGLGLVKRLRRKDGGHEAAAHAAAGLDDLAALGADARSALDGLADAFLRRVARLAHESRRKVVVDDRGRDRLGDAWLRGFLEQCARSLPPPHLRALRAGLATLEVDALLGAKHRRAALGGRIAALRDIFGDADDAAAALAEPRRSTTNGQRRRALLRSAGLAPPDDANPRLEDSVAVADDAVQAQLAAMLEANGVDDLDPRAAARLLAVADYLHGRAAVRAEARRCACLQARAARARRGRSGDDDRRVREVLADLARGRVPRAEADAAFGVRRAEDRGGDGRRGGRLRGGGRRLALLLAVLALDAPRSARACSARARRRSSVTLSRVTRRRICVICSFSSTYAAAVSSIWMWSGGFAPGGAAGAASRTVTTAGRIVPSRAWRTISAADFQRAETAMPASVAP
ncbi:hypothetical protein JL720_12412 [Aureococcus anophagefferens]|nr:hypothetical protein JL720_12412 [Aureococcus anophagefferens]